ncbi:MAG: hypothetical protein ACKPFD_18510 [Dolichospermum sp.]
MLDSGHHLGAIAALAYLHEKNIRLCFDFDKLSMQIWEELGVYY